MSERGVASRALVWVQVVVTDSGWQQLQVCADWSEELADLIIKYTTQ